VPAIAPMNNPGTNPAQAPVIRAGTSGTELSRTF
jgi:hypothetical protein